MEKVIRERNKKRMLRVSFPKGKVICYKTVITTYIETLKEIGVDNLQKVNLEISHLPLFSQTIYPQFKDKMMPLNDGWYVNTCSSTSEKYMQLKSISNQLNLNLEIELGYDFISIEENRKISNKAPKSNLLVKFPDGEYVAEPSSLDTYLQTIWKIGIDRIQRTGVEYGRKSLITFSKMYNGQIEVGKSQWLLAPGTTKDKYKVLDLINATLRLNLQITII